MAGKKPIVVAKGEVLRQEHFSAEKLDAKDKNENFGFKCLHYSVSEGSGSIKVHIINKTDKAGVVRVETIDAEATAGSDYEQLKESVYFKDGEHTKFVTIKIFDDDEWEPDEDFFVQLYEPESMKELEGKDTRTKITIIDDDKPGQIGFLEQSASIKAVA